MRARLAASAALAVGTLLATAPGVGSAASEPPETIDPEAPCVTSECHAKEVEYARLHYPEIVDECTECHEPEGVEHEFETEEAPDLCAECHEDLMEGIEEASRLHDPAEEDCMDCHEPHGSRGPGLLTVRNMKDLCFDCHEEDEVFEEDAVVLHGPVERGECTECHDPHYSERKKLLRADRVALCVECHDEVVETDDGKLANIRRLLDRNPEWHEPIREKGCTECHMPHSSLQRRLLKEPFPVRFYNAFDTSTYGLCFSCHETELATVKETRTATGFRDGDQNLHFLHVNKEKKGRSCRACHDPHAAMNALQIRAIVPFGKWNMPIGFTPSEAGGSCAPGCHEKRAYDRTK